MKLTAPSWIKESTGKKCGFSDRLMSSKPWKDYMFARVSFPGGYLGSSHRSFRRDRIIERLLREQGLENAGIIEWLSSTRARHLMDDEPRKVKEFEKAAIEATKHAFFEVAVWSHPDHGGSLACTQGIAEQLVQAAWEFEEERERNERKKTDKH